MENALRVEMIECYSFAVYIDDCFKDLLNYLCGGSLLMCSLLPKILDHIFSFETFAD